MHVPLGNTAVERPSRGETLYQRACKVLPGGVSRNAVLRHPRPVYARSASGCRIIDVDGVERLDFANNMASLIHGHADPEIVHAVTRQIRRGTAWNLATEVEVEFAEHMCARSPSFEMIRFVNSGTEAVMCCIKAARAFTNRPMIAKVEGAYHGIYDYAEVSQTSTPDSWGDPGRPARIPACRGAPRSVLDDVLVLPFNDVKNALALLDAHADRLACVLVDPLPHRVGMIPAEAPFIEAIHAWTRRNYSLMVFDEVITFRCAAGGAQEWYDVKPDLTALGKIIGGGFPVGAIAGSAKVMDVLNPARAPMPFPHSGTFSANPVTMTAGLTAMRRFDPEQVARLNALGERARRQITQAVADAEVPMCVTGAGSLFRLHPFPVPPRDYRTAFPTPHQAAAMKALVRYAFDHGIMLIDSASGALSTPMHETEIDRLTDVLAEAIHALRPMLQPVGA